MTYLSSEQHLTHGVNSIIYITYSTRNGSSAQREVGFAEEFELKRYRRVEPKTKIGHYAKPYVMVTKQDVVFFTLKKFVPVYEQWSMGKNIVLDSFHNMIFGVQAGSKKLVAWETKPQYNFVIKTLGDRHGGAPMFKETHVLGAEPIRDVRTSNYNSYLREELGFIAYDFYDRTPT